MVRGIALPIHTWPVVRLVASTVTFTLTIFAAPAKAQTSGEVGVTGHVAPRCWVVDGKTQSGVSAEPRTMCNHGSTTMRFGNGAPRTEIRPMIGPGSAIEHPSVRAVQEVIVSPRL